MKNTVWLFLTFLACTLGAQDPMNDFHLWPKEYLAGGTLICSAPATGTKEYDFTNWKFDPSEWLLTSSNGGCNNINASGPLEGGCNGQTTSTYYGQEIGCKPYPDGTYPLKCNTPETNQNIVRSQEGLYLKMRDLPAPITVNCTSGSAVSHVSGAQLSSTGRYNMGAYEFEYETFLGNFSGSDIWPALWFWHHDELDMMDNQTSGPIGEGYVQKTNYPHGNGPSVLRMEWTPFKLIFYRNGNKYFEVFKYYFVDQSGNNAGPVDIDCGEIIPTGYVKVNPVFPESDGRFPNPGGRYMQAFLSLSYNPWFCPDGLNDPANSKILIKRFTYTPTVYTNVNLNVDCNYNLLCPGVTPCHQIQAFDYNPEFVYPNGDPGGPDNFTVTNWNVINGYILSSNNTGICLAPYSTDFYIITATVQDVASGNQYSISQRFERPDPPTTTLFINPEHPDQERFLYVELNGYCPDDVTVTSIPHDAFTPGSPYPRPVNGSLLYELEDGVTLECVTISYPEPCTGNIASATTVFPCQQPLKGTIQQQGSGTLSQLYSTQYVNYNNFVINVSYSGANNTYQWQKISGNGYIISSLGNSVTGFVGNYSSLTIRVTVTNECGCSFSQNITLHNNSSENPPGFPIVVIRPNPATDRITVALGSDDLPDQPSEGASERSIAVRQGIGQVRVYDPTGRLCLDQCCDESAQQQTLNIAALPPGIYRIEITDTAGTNYTKSFIKQ